MGSLNVKIKYNEEGAYGSVDEKTLYVTHSRSSDYVSVYDNEGKMLFCYDGTMNNNILEAIISACSPYLLNDADNGFRPGVELMTSEDEARIK